MKILIVISGFTKSGGMRVLTNISNELIKIGDEVTFVFVNDFSEPYFPSLAKILRIKSIFTNFKIINNLMNKFLLILYLIRSSDEYGVVIASHNSTAFPVWLCTRRRANGFYYIQAYEPEFYGENLFQWTKKKLAELSYRLNLVKIVNAEIYKNYKEISAIHVVEPGIDLNLFRKNESEKNSNVINIGCIGRRDSWKGTAIIIDAFNLVCDKFKTKNISLQLNIAFELPSGLNEESLPLSIKLTKPHGDINLSNFYRLNDVFVATGLLQNGAFHYPCMEALACGCSVISNYSPAKDKYAYILKEVTVESLTEILLTALDDFINGRSKKMAENELEQYTWEIIALKFKKILSNKIICI